MEKSDIVMRSKTEVQKGWKLGVLEVLVEQFPI